VGAGVPLRAIVTVKACAVVMLGADGVTVTAGVVFAGGGFCTKPPPHAASHRLIVALNPNAICRPAILILFRLN
jgi:hypothetical protein